MNHLLWGPFVSFDTLRAHSHDITWGGGGGGGGIHVHVDTKVKILYIYNKILIFGQHGLCENY